MVWSGIALFYFFCLMLGFVLALLGAVFGGLGGHFHTGLGGHGVHIGHGFGGHGAHIEVPHGGHVQTGHASHAHAGGVDEESAPGASPLNGITLATFMVFFGGSGLVAVWAFKLGPLESVAFAIPTSLLIAAAQFALFVRIFVNAQASSEATMSETLGCEADVIVTIPVGHVGKITYVIKGSRYSAPAISADGEGIANGTRVQVVNVKGLTLVVRPL
jgi:membrane protein implicated in regulation of membrane protease activity